MVGIFVGLDEEARDAGRDGRSRENWNKPTVPS